MTPHDNMSIGHINKYYNEDVASSQKYSNITIIMRQREKIF